MTGRFQPVRAALAAAALPRRPSALCPRPHRPPRRPKNRKTRIVGGALAHTADTPWAIALNNSASPDPTGQCCGATLVAANKIVTAAHCATEAAGTYTAIQGRDKLADSGGKTSAISSIWADPAYGSQPGHDVAVMTLATPFTGVPTLPLETSTAADTAGATSVVYGWGTTEGTGPAATFQKVDGPCARRRVLRGRVRERGLHRRRARSAPATRTAARTPARVTPAARWCWPGSSSASCRGASAVRMPATRACTPRSPPTPTNSRPRSAASVPGHLTHSERNRGSVRGPSPCCLAGSSRVRRPGG